MYDHFKDYYQALDLYSTTLQPIKPSTTAAIKALALQVVAICTEHNARISIVLVKAVSTGRQTLRSRLQTPRGPLAWLHSLKAGRGAWDKGNPRKHCDNRGRWNFPWIIKKGLVRSLRPWEALLVNPTKVLWPRTPRDEGHRSGSHNPPLIPSTQLYQYTLNPLTTSHSNLCRFGRVKQVSSSTSFVAVVMGFLATGFSRI